MHTIESGGFKFEFPDSWTGADAQHLVDLWNESGGVTITRIVDAVYVGQFPRPYVPPQDIAPGDIPEPIAPSTYINFDGVDADTTHVAAGSLSGPL
jgi:hypothetical protein